jgi:hypothetical protein
VTATGGLEKQVTFTIDTENNITAFATKQEAGEVESFSTQDELASLAAKWPATHLAAVWNSIPGLTPVKKFTNRTSAIARIWKAIQSLNGDAGTESATAARKQPKKSKSASKGKPAKGATATPTNAAKAKCGKTGPKTTTTREGSKKAEVVALLQRKGGATLTEVMKATKWQAHSVRGFISGALGKKMGLNVVSVRRDDGERVYAITQ